MDSLFCDISCLHVGLQLLVEGLPTGNELEECAVGREAS